jgi:TolB protein
MSGAARATLAVTAALALVACARPAIEERRVAAEPLRIAYNVLEDKETDDYEVWIMDADGAQRRNLTDHPAVDWAYASHGQTLYIVSDRDEEKRRYRLYELDAVSGAARRITAFRVRDSWLGVRDDGNELVVASSKDGTPDLYHIDRQGNVLRRLTEDDTYDNDPIFSPDGTKVVWRSARTGVDELWLMELATGETRKLTEYPQGEDRESHDYHAGPPRWEPKRDVISFCSWRDGGHRIFSIRPDGTAMTRVSPGGTNACWHDWSPDGRYLAYDARSEDGDYDIYLLDTESGQVSRLTEGPPLEQAPVFVRGER